MLVDFKLLWRYLNLYWLKPFDCINDAATASMLARFPWQGKIVEIGSGDGVFSAVMHGGAFPFSYDRYCQAQPSQAGDIYDHHVGGAIRLTKRPSPKLYAVAVDRKQAHVEKVRELGIYERCVQACAENIPVPDEFADTVFCYIFHGLEDHEKMFSEARRIAKPSGHVLVLVYDASVRSAFLCHRLSSFFARKGCDRLARHLKRLDGGRCEELSNMSRRLDEWRLLWRRMNLEVQAEMSAVSRLQWMLYDTQTRPVLGFLIRLQHVLERLNAKVPCKLVWMVAWYPVASLWYALFARPHAIDRFGDRVGGCFLAFQLAKN